MQGDILWMLEGLPIIVFYVNLIMPLKVFIKIKKNPPHMHARFDTHHPHPSAHEPMMPSNSSYKRKESAKITSMKHVLPLQLYLDVIAISWYLH